MKIIRDPPSFVFLGRNKPGRKICEFRGPFLHFLFHVLMGVLFLALTFMSWYIAFRPG